MNKYKIPLIITNKIKEKVYLIDEHKIFKF